MWRHSTRHRPGKKSNFADSMVQIRREHSWIYYTRGIGAQRSPVILTESGLLAIFGECQEMTYFVATRLLVFPLIKQDFRVCHSLLARGDCASTTLNHQKWTRAGIWVQPDVLGLFLGNVGSFLIIVGLGRAIFSVNLGMKR